MNAYDKIHEYPKEQIEENIDLIMDIAKNIGEIRRIFPVRNLGDLMPCWNLIDFKIHYLGIQDRRERIKKCIRALREKHKELNRNLKERV